MNFIEFYNQEKFLFEDVHQRFEKSGMISTFDFHCILIWKANRAKTMHIKRLRKKGLSYESAVEKLISECVQKGSSKERLEWMMNGFGAFRLPTATAILAVLYPNEFTVYDIRVCEQLENIIEKDFSGLNDKPFSETLWKKYEEFKREVETCSPPNCSLRDKDRYLWGKSLCEQINNELKKAELMKI